MELISRKNITYAKSKSNVFKAIKVETFTSKRPSSDLQDPSEQVHKKSKKTDDSLIEVEE